MPESSGPSQEAVNAILESLMSSPVNNAAASDLHWPVATDFLAETVESVVAALRNGDETAFHSHLTFLRGYTAALAILLNGKAVRWEFRNSEDEAYAYSAQDEDPPPSDRVEDPLPPEAYEPTTTNFERLSDDDPTQLGGDEGDDTIDTNS